MGHRVVTKRQRHRQGHHRRGEPLITINADLMRMVGELPNGSDFTAYVCQVWKPTPEQEDGLKSRGWVYSPDDTLRNTKLFTTMDSEVAFSLTDEAAWRKTPVYSLGEPLGSLEVD